MLAQATSSGDAVQAAWIAAGAAVTVALITLVGQRSTSRRLGQPKDKDNKDSTVAEQLATLARGQVALVESSEAQRRSTEALERRVDVIEHTQLACVECPRRMRTSPVAGD